MNTPADANSKLVTSTRHWPAEWSPHDATWIAWPHNRDTWPGRFSPIEAIFKRMVAILADVEPVHVLSGPDAASESAELALADIDNVTIHAMETNDCWIRDFGPTFVQDSAAGVVGVDWRYNAWGGKWPPWDEDAANAKRILQAINIAHSPSDLTCEGGALETDGEGTLMTTSSAILTVTRNPDFTQAEVETRLKTQLGVSKILWVDGGGLAGDDTDSHIDQLVRFTHPGTVVAAVAYTSDDENHLRLSAQYECLRHMTDAKGRLLNIVPLMTPPPRYISNQRVPESYCNFYIANEIVLVPTFGFRPTDDAAIEILKQQFATRTIVPLPATDLVWGLGAFHCATQQQCSPLGNLTTEKR